MKLKPKTPSSSQTIKAEIVCPDDTNPMGILMGGKLVQWMDIAAAVSAQIHAGGICVTASINHVEFKQPARLGDIVVILSKLTRAFTTSMEIFVQAFVRSFHDTPEVLIGEAYFTFVALNQCFKATAVPEVMPESEAERARYDHAGKRRKSK
jgi:acyl-CoA hydrolase